MRFVGTAWRVQLHDAESSQLDKQDALATSRDRDPDNLGLKVMLQAASRKLQPQASRDNMLEVAYVLGHARSPTHHKQACEIGLLSLHCFEHQYAYRRRLHTFTIGLV